MREPTGLDPTPLGSLMTAAALLHDLPAPWIVETFQNCDSDWSLVVMRADAEGETYLVSDTMSGLILSELRDDELRLLANGLGPDALVSIVAARTPLREPADRAA